MAKRDYQWVNKSSKIWVFFTFTISKTSKRPYRCCKARFLYFLNKNNRISISTFWEPLHNVTKTWNNTNFQRKTLNRLWKFCKLVKKKDVNMHTFYQRWAWHTTIWTNMKNLCNITCEVWQSNKKNTVKVARLASNFTKTSPKSITYWEIKPKAYSTPEKSSKTKKMQWSTIDQ